MDRPNPSSPSGDGDNPADPAPAAGYEEWKRAKIEHALAQARDRSCLIPVDQVWRELDLEG